MDTVTDNQSVTSEAAAAPHLEIPVKSFISTLERNKYIVERFSQGIIQLVIGKEVGLSEMRISQVVRANKDLVKVNNEFEKVRRFRRLKHAEEKSSKAIVAKDVSDLVKLIEAQRKELEGDESAASTVNNIQINIKIDSPQPELWQIARSLLGGA